MRGCRSSQAGLLAVVVVAAAGTARGAPYYAAPTGSGSDCTLDRPCSLDTGVGRLSPGDTLFLRGGTYRQTVWIGTSGTGSAPIEIAGYPGETAVIDGDDALPAGEWGALFAVEGDYVTVRDLEIARSLWMGLVLRGAHDAARNVESHGHWENGILLAGDDGLAEACRVHDSARSNQDCVRRRSSWASGLSAARHPDGCVIRGNTVWHNWGEGISTYEATNTLIEDNVSYDNFSVNLYLSDATDVLARRNIIYATGAITCDASQIGIAIGSEAHPPSPAAITVINNLVFHTRHNFDFWTSDGAGLVDDLIAYNTFVDATGDLNVRLLDGAHANTRFLDNLIVQGDATPLCAVETGAGLLFASNGWSSAPCAAAAGAGDVIGEPRLERSGPTGAGELGASYFRLLADSPMRDAARTLDEVAEDYFRTPRGTAPDLGAHEYVTPAADADGDVDPDVADPPDETDAPDSPDREDAAADGTPDHGPDAPDGGAASDGSGGCGCRATGGPASAAGATALLGLLWAAASARCSRWRATCPSRKPHRGRGKRVVVDGSQGRRSEREELHLPRVRLQVPGREPRPDHPAQHHRHDDAQVRQREDRHPRGLRAGDRARRAGRRAAAGPQDPGLSAFHECGVAAWKSSARRTRPPFTTRRSPGASWVTVRRWSCSTG
ncbi:MAG: right-handed parallel beta-helix repeat-containing protein [Deltaproteobacteria bacterium]|nr:right-handed parallel beta-helix repeat-containing protein [Deltaproteobacteria bacterium]